MGDNSSAFLDKGLANFQNGSYFDKKAVEKGEDPAMLEKAKNYYIRAIEYYMTGLKYIKDERIKDSTRQKISSLMDRVDIIKAWLKAYNDSNEKRSNNNMQHELGNNNDPSFYMNQAFPHAEHAISMDKKACEVNKDPQLFEDARKSYIKAIELYLKAIKNLNDERLKAPMREKINSYMDRVELIKEWLHKFEKTQRQGS